MELNVIKDKILNVTGAWDCYQLDKDWRSDRERINMMLLAKPFRRRKTYIGLRENKSHLVLEKPLKHFNR